MFVYLLQVLSGLIKPIGLLIENLNAYLSKRRVDKEVKPLLDLQVQNEIDDMDIINAARKLHNIKKD